MTSTVGELGYREICSLLRSDQGLRLKTGPFGNRIRSALPQVAQAVANLYGNYPLLQKDDFIDFDVGVSRPSGLRRWWQPQVSFQLDGNAPFNPLPGDQGFPLLEWGLNWCVYGMCHQYLILHAAVLERGGRALILPAPSGSGKSTLCAALLFNGWRLLSDELALLDPVSGQCIANPRPVSLKNESITVIGELVSDIEFGSRVHETSKGTVAHFAAPKAAVDSASSPAWPAWIVLPRWQAGSALKLQPLDKARTLMHLVENAFNYDVYGAEGFELLSQVVTRSACFSFEYSDLGEAIACFSKLSHQAGDGLASNSLGWSTSG